MIDLTPKQIVSELNRFIIGQVDAKKAVAVAIRNRWRRLQLPAKLQEEIYPKNILMIGPTGVGKTEISRRLAKIISAPFLKIEATKFTEVGYVGRDVEQIIRDLVESSIALVRQEMRLKVRSQAKIEAETRVIKAIAGEDARDQTLDMFRKKLRDGLLDDKEIAIEMREKNLNLSLSDLATNMGPLNNSGLGSLNIIDLFNFNNQGQNKKKRIKVKDSYDLLIEEEADKLLNEENIIKEALKRAEETGIVFLDEIDKVCDNSQNRGANVSREGVQRDLLPLIEGTTVSTKYGAVKTDHILFIASGAFHLSRPSDLLPELQGRLPIRVELKNLSKVDFLRILTETDNALTIQYKELMNTEGLEIDFHSTGIEEIARIAESINNTVESIGARRLYTVLEKVFEDLGYSAPEMLGEKIKIDETFVKDKLKDIGEGLNEKNLIL